VTRIRYATILLATLCAAAPVCAGFPYDTETGREVAIVGTSGFLLGLGRLADRTGDALPDAGLAAADPARINALDRGAAGRWSPAAGRASDVTVAVLLAAPVGQLAVGPGRLRAGRLAAIYGETLLLEGATVYALKNLVGRPRPFVFNVDPRIPPELRRSADAARSWPSGHTAHAFAAAVFCGSVFARLQPHSPARGWVWGGGLALAATTGVLRYAAGRHYPTDLLAGAVIGAAAGWLVPRWHEVAADSGGGTAPLAFAVRLAF
jgi:membrane-associated phospholipid phosphatase